MKDLNYYMALDYPVEMRRRGEDFEVEFRDLRGCVSSGLSPDEAYSNLLEAKREWLEMALERGMDIPEPSPAQADRHSGRILVRCPRDMHGRLLELARDQDVSLNQLVCAALAGFVATGGDFAARAAEQIRVSPYLEFGQFLLGSNQQLSIGRDAESQTEKNEQLAAAA
jgi:antitoxin HicB